MSNAVNVPVVTCSVPEGTCEETAAEEEAAAEEAGWLSDAVSVEEPEETCEEAGLEETGWEEGEDVTFGEDRMIHPVRSDADTVSMITRMMLLPFICLLSLPICEIISFIYFIIQDFLIELYHGWYDKDTAECSGKP